MTIFNKKGMTLFIAVVIMGILLLISFAAANIALKGTIFASSGRDSQYAYYAAEAGMECAIYWDSKPAVSAFDPTAIGSSVTCANQTSSTGDLISGTTTTAIVGNATYSRFGFKLDEGVNPTDACAIITVNKVGATTHIYSRGYNNCTGGRRVERGIEVTY